MIDAASVMKIFSVLMGMWAMGYGVGQMVSWVHRIGTIA